MNEIVLEYWKEFAYFIQQHKIPDGLAVFKSKLQSKLNAYIPALDATISSVLDIIFAQHSERLFQWLNDSIRTQIDIFRFESIYVEFDESNSNASVFFYKSSFNGNPNDWYSWNDYLSDYDDVSDIYYFQDLSQYRLNHLIKQKDAHDEIYYLEDFVMTLEFIYVITQEYEKLTKKYAFLNKTHFFTTGHDYDIVYYSN